MTRPMTPASSAATPTGTARWGWRLLITVSAVLVLNGIGLYLVIVDTHSERTIAAHGLHSLRGDRLDIPASYVGLAAIAALETMLTHRGKEER